MKKRLNFIAAAFTLTCAFVLTACSSAANTSDTSSAAPTATTQPTQAPTATPQPTQAPTATPQPTQAPTATPQPTQTPTATPAAEATQGAPEIADETEYEMTDEMLQNPDIEGRIAEIGADYISVIPNTTVIGSGNNASVMEGTPSDATTVSYNADTLFWSAGLTQGQAAAFAPASASDISAGQTVAVFGTEAGGNFTAAQIVIMNFTS